MDAAQIEYVESFGRFWESQGGSRTAGKILGWLMISDPPHQSSAQLVAALSVSHGSISTLARQLESLGFIERTSFPGDRSSYYALNSAGWVGAVSSSVNERIPFLAQLGNRGLELSQGVDPHRSHGLVLMAEFLDAEWPSFLERMKKYVSNRLPDSAPNS